MREHTLEIPVRWGDLDPAGIIYYPNVFHYFETAIEEFFQAHGLNYNQMAARFRTGFPRVAASAEFHAPIRLSDVLLCRVFVEKMGNTSLTFGFELKRKKDGVVCVTGKVTNVALNPGTWRPVPLPEGLRQMIEGPLGKPG